MKKMRNKISVDELRDALNLEELKKPVAHPEMFSFFMKYAVKKKNGSTAKHSHSLHFNTFV